MPKHLAPTTAPPSSTTTTQQPQPHAKTLRENATRRLSRSPHPYHRLKSELPHPFERVTASASSSCLHSTAQQHDDDDERQGGLKGAYKDSTGSESGTEADDEHFLKGLPAPKPRLHKGLRGEDGTVSSSPSPRLSPVEHSFSGVRSPISLRKQKSAVGVESEEERAAAKEKYRQKRRIEVVRRSAEAGLLIIALVLMCLDSGVRRLLWHWKKGIPQHFCKLRNANMCRTTGAIHNDSCSDSSIPSAFITKYPSFKSVERTILDSTACCVRSGSTALPTTTYSYCQLITIGGYMGESVAVYNTWSRFITTTLDTFDRWSRRIESDTMGAGVHSTACHGEHWLPAERRVEKESMA